MNEEGKRKKKRKFQISHREMNWRRDFQPWIFWDWPKQPQNIGYRNILVVEKLTKKQKVAFMANALEEFVSKIIGH